MPLSNEKYIDVDGIRTHCYDKGEGDTVVLLHGSNCAADLSADCAANWSRNFQGLAQTGRVIALDRIGQGYTDNPRDLENYTMATDVAHVAAFMRALGLRNVHLVGHSRGGYVATRTTLEHPDLIKTITIVDSGTLAPGLGRHDAVMAGSPEPRLVKESQRWVLQRYSFGYEHIDDEWLDALTAVAATPKYKEALARMSKMTFLTHLEKQKGETLGMLRDRGMRKPTLMIWSYNDPTAPIEQGHALFEIVAEGEPRSAMHIINQSGHFPYREHPEHFNSLVQGWVALHR